MFEISHLFSEDLYQKKTVDFTSHLEHHISIQLLRVRFLDLFESHGASVFLGYIKKQNIHKK